MARDAYASLRMPADLKREVEKIAAATSRTLSSTCELLLRRGVQDFKRDGVLIEARTTAAKRRAQAGQPTGSAEEEAFAERIAGRIVEKVLEKIEAGEGKGDGEHHAAA